MLIAKLSGVRIIDQTKVRTTWWQVLLASMNSSAQETGDTDTCTVNCCFKHSIVSLHLCKEYVTAGKLKTVFLLTSDKVLNVLLYGSLCFNEIQYVGERVMVVTCQR